MPSPHNNRTMCRLASNTSRHSVCLLSQMSILPRTAPGAPLRDKVSVLAFVRCTCSCSAPRKTTKGPLSGSFYQGGPLSGFVEYKKLKSALGATRYLRPVSALQSNQQQLHKIGYQLYVNTLYIFWCLSRSIYHSASLPTQEIALTYFSMTITRFLHVDLIWVLVAWPLFFGNACVDYRHCFYL